MKNHEPVEAEYVEGFGQSKVRLFIEGKRYVFLMDKDTFKNLIHTEGEKVRELTLKD